MQPTQSGRVRGMPSTWQGTGQHSKQRTYINTQISSSRWASQLERRPVPRFAGLLHSLYQPRCCCYTSFNAAPLPPPPRPWLQRSLRLLRSCTSSARRFATCSFSVTNLRFMYCSAASTTRLNHSPGFFGANIQCFTSVG